MIQLGPRTAGERHGEHTAGPVVMDQPSRDAGVTPWARLRIGEAECTLVYGYEDDLITARWHGFIVLDGIATRVAIDPETWLLTFHETMQPWIGDR